MLAAKKNILDSADLLLQENILSTLEYRAAVDESLWLINSKKHRNKLYKRKIKFFKGYVFRQFHLEGTKFFLTGLWAINSGSFTVVTTYISKWIFCT